MAALIRLRTVTSDRAESVSETGRETSGVAGVGVSGLPSRLLLPEIPKPEITCE